MAIVFGILLILLCLMSFKQANEIMAAAKSAMHEIEGILYYVLAGVLFTGSLICFSLESIIYSLNKLIPKEGKEIEETSIEKDIESEKTKEFIKQLEGKKK